MSADLKPAVDALFAEAHAAFSPLAAEYKLKLARFEEEANDVLDDLVAGDVTPAEAQEAVTSLGLALRSALVSAGLDSREKAPGAVLGVIERVLPLLLKLVLA